LDYGTTEEDATFEWTNAKRLGGFGSTDK